MVSPLYASAVAVAKSVYVAPVRALVMFAVGSSANAAGARAQINAATAAPSAANRRKLSFDTPIVLLPMSCKERRLVACYFYS